MPSTSRSKNAIRLRLPDLMRAQATQYAQAEGVSLNQFISLAVTERLARTDMERAHPRSAAVAADSAKMPGGLRPDRKTVS